MRTFSGRARSSVFVLFPLAAALLATACDDKKADVKPAPSAQPTASAPAATVSAMTSTAPAPVASAPPAKSFGEKLKCETLLPEAQRQTLGLLNFKMTQTTPCPECGPTCSLVRPDRPFEGVSVAYACQKPYEKAAADKVVDETKKTFKKPATVTNGRGGVMGEKDNGAFYSAVVFDDDTDCQITVDWMRGDRKVVEPLIKVAVQGAKSADVLAAKK